jgi:hypothetical protein
MKSLPDVLFEMSQKGADETEIQFLFDAMMEAETRGCRYLNVYNWREESVHFAKSREEPDDQLKRARQHWGATVVGFENDGETWVLR